MRKQTEDIELTPLIDHRPEVNESRLLPFVYLCRCLCFPLCLVILFVTSSTVLSTQVTRHQCTITCTKRPNCIATYNNKTFETHQGSCSWSQEVAECICYSANGVVSVNPFIFLSTIWTLVAVFSGGALVLFIAALTCRCCRRHEEQSY